MASSLPEARWMGSESVMSFTPEEALFVLFLYTQTQCLTLSSLRQTGVDLVRGYLTPGLWHTPTGYV